ncbi:hypothetical protein Egran_02112 [Elaphomyces granulatus]|uniref:Saccharopine dehydrogenase-like C-terminal domain-containing protein n=1 Tax=Elaphomyces granulatus TaxID=519963 RepID=A0A232M1E3_9EURO|nr:hypothetical protein Egran_02112 [Elaphomyces granulatus]
MQALDEEVKAAGITVMNEIGLDPMEGGSVRAFKSFCCGLPAPENSDNPLGYKFSWSSRGVLLALKNEAKYLENGKEVYVRSEDLMGAAKPYHTGFLGFNFVAYGNRDSTGYRERYNIPEAQTVIRGSLRYAGFPELIKVLVDIDFLSEEEQNFLTEPIAWKEATAHQEDPRC